MWTVYILRCADNSLYTGIAVDVEKRLEEHRSGGPRGAKYLRGRAPFRIVWQTRVQSKGLALSMEKKIKQLSKEKKEMLVKKMI
jgi:putative endonuclease